MRSLGRHPRDVDTLDTKPPGSQTDRPIAAKSGWRRYGPYVAGGVLALGIIAWALIGTHRSANILLLSIYCIQSIVLALFSINTGAKLWPVKPDAINLRIGILWPIWARTSRILNFMDARRSTD